MVSLLVKIRSFLIEFVGKLGEVFGEGVFFFFIRFVLEYV